MYLIIYDIMNNLFIRLYLPTYILY